MHTIFAMTLTSAVSQIHALKADLKDKNAPYGVDLLLPQVGGSARKTNVSNSRTIACVVHGFTGLSVCLTGKPASTRYKPSSSLPREMILKAD